MMKKNKIWITGSNGMVGQALIRNLSENKNYNILKTSRKNLDQTNQLKTNNWVTKNKPDTIIISSALVGGIQLNAKIPADFLYQNSLINLNIINAAHLNNCKKIVFLGASCMYPKLGKQPFKENSLMNGKVEETNEGYALSKIIGLKFINFLNAQHNKNYISIIPTASYGPKDCYDESKNHVIPALIKKIYEAKINNKSKVVLWGTGKVKREFIHVDDMASGIMHIIKNYNDSSPINLGTGEEISIKNLASIISKTIQYKGKIIFDDTKPDGIKRKILDNSKIQKLKWKHKVSLHEGLSSQITEYIRIRNKIIKK